MFNGRGNDRNRRGLLPFACARFGDREEERMTSLLMSRGTRLAVEERRKEGKKKARLEAGFCWARCAREGRGKKWAGPTG